MNRYFLTGAVILACLCIFITIAYACIEIDVAIWDYQRFVVVTEDIENPVMVSVTADVEYGGPATRWEWTWPSGLECDEYNIEENDYDSTAEFWSDTPGIYTVWAKAWNATPSDDDDWAYVYVVDINLSDGGYLALNGDLMEIDITLLPSNLNRGSVILDSSSNKIQVYSDSAGDNEISLPATWYVARDQVPSSVWVKGVEVSSQMNDAVLDISYDKKGWGWGSSEIIDTDTASFTVLDVEITEPTGTNFDHQFAFEGEYATCTFDVEGETGTGITALDNVLEWDLEKVGDDFCIWESDPDPAVGPTITFANGGYPSGGSYPLHNSAWGDKTTLTLTHPSSGLVDTLDLEIFFDPDEKKFNGVPNWFYYWKDGDVIPEIKTQDFEYLDEDKSGKYDPPTGTLYLCNWAPVPSYNYSDTWYNMYYKTSVNTGWNGICETAALGDDDQEIDVGEGEPYATAIYNQGDGWMTTEQGDDVKDGDIINTGPDGVCDTTPFGNDDYVWYGSVKMGLNRGKPYTICITDGDDPGDDDWLHSNSYYYDDEIEDYDIWMMPKYNGDDKLDLTGAMTATFSINATGLEKCAITCIHEMKHRDNDDLTGTDSDSDVIPNSYEIDFRINGNEYPKLDPYRRKTYISFDPSYGYETNFGLANDDEFTAYMSQHSGSEDPTKDWSKDGMRWHTSE